MSEATYTYTAIDAAGRNRVGAVTAASELAALRAVAASGLSPVSVSRATSARRVIRPGRAVPKELVANATREISVLLRARVPLSQGLAAMAEHESNAAFAATLSDVAHRVDSGDAISDAVAAHPAVFGDVYVQSLRAAERTGRLADITAALAVMLERRLATSRTLGRAMAYPLIVMLVIALALSVLVVFVVPRFSASLGSSGGELPLLTRTIAGLGSHVAGLWWAYGVAAIGAVWGLMAVWRSTPGREAIEALIERTPIFGAVLTAVTTARFARVLGVALGSGLNLIESVELAGRATGRSAFVALCDGMVQGLRRGEPLSDLLRNSRFLPGFARRLLAAGQDAAELAEASLVVADHYDERAEHLSKGVSAMLEPILTLIMAGVVLLIAISVFQPMWQMVRMAH